jgi:hypothetical protein
MIETSESLQDIKWVTRSTGLEEKTDPSQLRAATLVDSQNVPLTLVGDPCPAT